MKHTPQPSPQPTHSSRPRFWVTSIVLLCIIAVETILLYNTAPMEVAKMLSDGALTAQNLNLTALIVGLPIILAGIAAFLAVLIKQTADIAPRTRLTLLILMAAPTLIVLYYLIALLTYPGSASTDASGHVAELLVMIASWMIWSAYTIGAIGLGIIATLGLVRAVRSSKQ